MHLRNIRKQNIQWSIKRSYIDSNWNRLTSNITFQKAKKPTTTTSHCHKNGNKLMCEWLKLEKHNKVQNIKEIPAGSEMLTRCRKGGFGFSFYQPTWITSPHMTRAKSNFPLSRTTFPKKKMLLKSDLFILAGALVNADFITLCVM